MLVTQQNEMSNMKTEIYHLFSQDAGIP